MRALIWPSKRSCIDRMAVVSAPVASPPSVRGPHSASDEIAFQLTHDDVVVPRGHILLVPVGVFADDQNRTTHAQSLAPGREEMLGNSKTGIVRRIRERKIIGAGARISAVRI